MKCSIMLHHILVLTVCQSIRLGVSSIHLAKQLIQFEFAQERIYCVYSMWVFTKYFILSCLILRLPMKPFVTLLVLQIDFLLMFCFVKLHKKQATKCMKSSPLCKELKKNIYNLIRSPCVPPVRFPRWRHELNQICKISLVLLQWLKGKLVFFLSSLFNTNSFGPAF